MSIKEIMTIGCEGMTEEQRIDEKWRRVKVAEKVTKLGEEIKTAEKLKKLAQEQAAKVAFEKKLRKLRREMSRIKGEENLWLKKAAWFLYY